MMQTMQPFSLVVPKVNKWAAQGVPFLFYTNYNGKLWYAAPLTEVNADEIQYAFPRVSNAKEVEVVKEKYWEVEPPLFSAYEKAFQRVKAGLLRGDSFLTNLTWAMKVDTQLTQEQLFAATQAPYRLMVKGRFVVFSPESFVQLRGNNISTYPMKGTMVATDAKAGERLLSDTKEKEEHATVVDLLRNDLSMVAKGVRVERYRYLESIETPRGQILQTSSEIVGELRPEYHDRWGDALATLLPAGSVTGAPKAKTLEIIEEAEPFPRGCYTGVCGIFDGEMLQSAVMIRFVEVMPDGGFFFHSGGGITAKSRVEDEWNEVILKTNAPFS